MQLLLRFHIAHVLQVCSRHTADHDAGVPARGLNGEAYRGHVFWDELYVYPFLNFRLPEVTRGLLMYRYRRLAEARAAAREAGYQGAMFPWQSGSDGTRGDPGRPPQPAVGPVGARPQPQPAPRQRGDLLQRLAATTRPPTTSAFLRDYGAEMMLEIARFWASIAHFNPERDRYEIHGVMGPDEFHEKYPGADEGGLRNNAYTNVHGGLDLRDRPARCSTCCPRAAATHCGRGSGSPTTSCARWERDEPQDVRALPRRRRDQPVRGLRATSRSSTGSAYRAKHGNIQRLDRILQAEGDDPDRYKLAKQADTVMLFFLFPDERAAAAVRAARLRVRPGHRAQDDRLLRPADLPRLDAEPRHPRRRCSPALDPESSWERFLVALESDVGDVQGGTTKEGIHMGVMSGTLDLLQRDYVGSDIRDGVLYFDSDV